MGREAFVGAAICFGLVAVAGAGLFQSDPGRVRTLAAIAILLMAPCLLGAGASRLARDGGVFLPAATGAVAGVVALGTVAAFRVDAYDIGRAGAVLGLSLVVWLYLIIEITVLMMIQAFRKSDLDLL